ncbi:PVC-type heme-binding CxxCH protein [uncultured Gimesia sp.]|uniref:PVC-type heme-binding CxxCH protein n=1 Tax=uncultured Gimesia sp. TaxID=1678688 RepID=UPI0030DBDF3C|tara:strand:- start:57189 stop:60182 length:2994 start_codon:yes stop_codon:yes gene_type:complete
MKMQLFLLLFVGLCFRGLAAQETDGKSNLPHSPDDRVQIELFAENPQIVTPTGIDVDECGRVWAIESNTHFPPEGYRRADSDRILVLSDQDGDGKADEVVTFADGLTHTMSVTVKPTWLKYLEGNKNKQNVCLSNEVFIATRNEVFLMIDEDGDLKADQKKTLLKVKTAGAYPHNGLAGFAFDAAGWMFIGFGENLGAKYTITAADGTSFSGGGEGGNLYRCRPDGTELSLWATGFWNPHASCVDAFGHVFTVDNDPDSRPPCRLLHIIQGGDYGYRFRNGRKGLHPFTSWDGELPGTLPMVAGTGEAPSGVLAYESNGLPAEYIGNLLVTSWGDHRIDRFQLQPQGASFSAKREPLIEGGENFRPVGIATAPDGSLYCTDWVLRDYKLHSKGRIWRISQRGKKPVAQKNSPAMQKSEVYATTVKKSLKSSHLPTRRLAAWMIGEERDLTLRSIVGNQKMPLRSRYEAMMYLSKNFNPAYVRVINSQRATKQEGPYHPLHTEVMKYDDERLPVNQIVQLLQNPDGSDSSYLLNSLQGLVPLIRVMGRTHSAVVAKILNQAIEKQDPFVDSTMIRLISETFKEAHFKKTLNYSKTLSPRLRLLLILAARQSYPKSEELIQIALSNPEADLKRAIVQWIAEENLVSMKPEMLAIINSQEVSGELFDAVLAGIQMLEGEQRSRNDEALGTEFAFKILENENYSMNARARALTVVPPSHAKLSDSLLKSFLSSNHQPITLAVLRALQLAPRKTMLAELRTIIADESLVEQIRCDALVALSAGLLLEDSSTSKSLLIKLTDDSNSSVRAEAIRALRAFNKDKRVQSVLAALQSAEQQNLSDLAALALGKKMAVLKWEDVAEGGDPDAGRRVFFHPYSVRCSQCHAINHQGGNVGPDLSVVARAMDRKKLAQSILHPSAEIAPQFTVWTFVLENGKVINGVILGEANKDNLSVGTVDGKVVAVKRADIDEQIPQKTSLMPEKLSEKLTRQELCDLIAYLQTLK